MSQVFLRVKDSAFPKKLATLTGSRSSTSKAPRPTPNGNMWVTPHDKNRYVRNVIAVFISDDHFPSCVLIFARLESYIFVDTSKNYFTLHSKLANPPSFIQALL